MALRVLDTDVHVRDSGSGRPTLFLHGNPDTGDVWSALIARMGDTRRCIAPDLPGFGTSAAPTDYDYALANQARFVDALLESLGITAPIDLVVHDIGGPFGLAWATEHADKVRSITILNTVFAPDYRWHFWARVWRAPILGELSMAVMNRALFRNEVRRGFPGISRAYADEVYAQITPATKLAVLKWYRTMDPSVFAGWDERLRTLAARVPTQVIWGDRDPYIPAEFAARFGGTVHRLPDCGHWPQLEATAEVARLLTSFLRD